MFNTFALANTFALIDIVLHPLFHIWVSISPSSYERAMNLFVAGLQFKVTEFDTSILPIAMGTIIEAGMFWLLGAAVALIYNRFARCALPQPSPQP